MKAGILGLPNVGKSTLFNALTAAGAESANYPFCTIEPNVGIVKVPDARLERIRLKIESKQLLPALVEILDIAGLVRGASKGEGLGNQFLGHVRNVDALLHVVRCFDDTDVVHVDGKIDPLADIDTIDTELILADLEAVERQILRVQKKAKGGDKDAKAMMAVLGKANALLTSDKAVRAGEWSDDEAIHLKAASLLTQKPILYVCNVGEADAVEGNDYSDLVRARAKTEGAQAIVVSAQFEAEVSEIEDPEEREVFLAEAGIVEPGLARLARAAYTLLGLQTYFTAGPKEIRAWTIKVGATAPQAAGVIHGDFERGFIRAQVYGLNDLETFGSEAALKAAGKMRSEGKSYIVQDGDIMHFLFNV